MNVLLYQGLFTVMYAAAFYQVGGSLLIFSQEHVDRSIGGWEIPVSWMAALPTVAFILITPCAVRLWKTLASRGRDPDATVKLAWGLITIGLAYLLLAVVTPSLAALEHASVPWWWMLTAFVLFGAADMLVWPNQISLTSRLAPAALSALLGGGWYITIGLGTAMTGYIGVYAQLWGYKTFFLTLGLCVTAAWLLSPWFRGLMYVDSERKALPCAVASD